MTEQQPELTILFADICRSTGLYEKFGDLIARNLVSQCLGLITDQVRQKHGKVIKTIGDEVMCTFSNPDDAVEAAVSIQDRVMNHVSSQYIGEPEHTQIRVGLHHGPAIVEEDDVYGDAVNVASRMATIAKGGQIITTQATSSLLNPPHLGRTRRIDRLKVKGKRDAIEIYEVVWQPERVTVMKDDTVSIPKTASELLICYRSQIIRLDGRSALDIGRDKHADINMDDALVSREHACIEYRRGKFYLVDKSINGTYLQTPLGAFYVRREEILLVGHGRISPGREFGQAVDVILYESI